MSLLTLPDADAQIRGNLISEWQSIRHYCVSQLKTVWQHMRNNLALSEEERTFFVNRCLKTFHEVAASIAVNVNFYTSVYTCLYIVY